MWQLQWAVAARFAAPFCLCFGRCERRWQGARASDLLEDMIEEDQRLQLFYLEGILKLYRKRYDELEDQYRTVKALEDKLGQHSAARGFAGRSCAVVRRRACRGARGVGTPSRAELRGRGRWPHNA